MLIWNTLPKMQIINLLFLLLLTNFNKFTHFLWEMQYKILLPDFALHAGSAPSVFYSICELLKEMFCLICCQLLCESAAVLLVQLLNTRIMSPWISCIHYFRCMCEQDTGFSSILQGSTTCRESRTSRIEGAPVGDDFKPAELCQRPSFILLFVVGGLVFC